MNGRARWEKILKRWFSRKIFRFTPEIKGRKGKGMEIIGAERGHVSVNNHFDPVDPFAAGLRVNLHYTHPIPSIDLTMSSNPKSHSSALSARWLFPVRFSLLLFLFFPLLFFSPPPQSGHSCVYIYIYTYYERVRARCIVSSLVPRRSDCCRVSR